MPFCASCGAAVDGRFCAKCGATVDASAAPAGGGVPVQSRQPAAAPMADNAASALCYVLGLLTGILFLVLEPYSRNRAVRFHAFQSIFLNVALILTSIVLNILAGIMFALVGFFFFWVLWPLFYLACLGLWIYMIVSAYQGKTVVLPVIGLLAKQQA